MDPLASVLVAVAALFVWAYVTYVVVRSAVRDGLHDHVRQQQERGASDSGESDDDPQPTA